MIFAPEEHGRAALIAQLAATNPFSVERFDLERRILGEHAAPEPTAHWTLSASIEGEQRENVRRIREVTIDLLAHARLEQGEHASEQDLRIYEDLAVYALYETHRDELDEVLRNAERDPETPPGTPGWKRFNAEHARLLRPEGRALPSGYAPEHLYAVFFQIRRAFRNIFASFIGASPSAGRLRESIWQSIFTSDLRAYTRGLHARMADFATLITGESGTGKELVASAIGRSGYIPHDPRQERFTGATIDAFTPVNLAALSPTLIESELFGHRKGAFTGATSDRVGYFESCPVHGSVFLDEIGELDEAFQVKILRVLQDRTLARVGEHRARRFQGKIIAATNRDLDEAMREGEFRADLYYRLCGDIVRTPPLREQFEGAPGERAGMVRFIVRRLVPGDERFARELATRCESVIDASLGEGYRWPGNFRELEQCVRNIVIRGECHPSPSTPTGNVERTLAGLRCTADDLLCAYCAATYNRLGTYQGVADQLGIDRRTAKARIERATTL